MRTIVFDGQLWRADFCGGIFVRSFNGFQCFLQLARMFVLNMANPLTDGHVLHVTTILTTIFSSMETT
jgi:hypothetical protein